MGDSESIQTVCPVCDFTEAHFLSSYRGHHADFSKCSIVSCDQCKMVFVHPMPDEHFLYEYNQSYFSNAHGGISTDLLTVAFHSAINLVRVLYVENFLKNGAGVIKSVLEIGPGPGHFARHWLQRHNETVSYTAVDSDTSCYDILAGMGVSTYTDLKQIPEQQNFDLVVISHVLEHTADPQVFIDDCTKLLSPGGILFIEVPCNDHQHKNTIEPHLLFFDKKPMELLLVKQGFRIGKLSYHGSTIVDLQKPISFLKKMYSKGKNFLYRRGVRFPFSVAEAGMEGMIDPLERAVVKPFKAHKEQTEPSWWLRAIAIKN